MPALLIFPETCPTLFALRATQGYWGKFGFFAFDRGTGNLGTRRTGWGISAGVGGYSGRSGGI